MTHDLDYSRASAQRSIFSAPAARLRERQQQRVASRLRMTMALTPRLRHGSSQAAIRILETTWRLWREPSITA